jgi:hypothetical protein
MLPEASPGYLHGLIERALATAASHPDANTRDRAVARVKRLERALLGMVSGVVGVGSRTPVAGTPAWATLEVVKGGFATGGLLAGGELLPHEEALGATGRGRTPLNVHAFGDGLAELTERLTSGRYRVEVPEEGALLVAAWLLARGEDERAFELVDVIAPWFDRLRFYPVPAESAAPSSAFVRLQPVGDTVADLAAVKVPKQVARMNETLRVWSPFEDRVVALLRETMDAEVPYRRFPDGWRARAAELLAEHGRLVTVHGLCKRSSGTKSNLGRLVAGLRSYVTTGSVTERERGVARVSLAAIAAKRGTPGSQALTQLRAVQAEVAAAPTTRELADVVAARLAALPKDGGLASVEPWVVPVADAEARRVGVRAGVAIPPSIAAKLDRSLEAPLEDLVARSVIPSGEVLAIVAPQITAQVRAAGIADPALRRVYESVYAAFRKRRSLLLLDLQSQVKIEELPWVAAIQRERAKGLGAQVPARLTLERLATLAITAYPDVILPNKLITELQGLANAAKLEAPLVEEIAADIFMGTFSGKFVRAAKVAARMLRGTLYETYYGLPFERVLALPEVTPAKTKSRWGTAASAASPEFAALCRKLARAQAKGYGVARNGTIVEQEQLLTTHNLAVLFDALGLKDALAESLPGLARRCFTAIVKAYAQRTVTHHAGLLRLKNSAYAWRQMVFFLAVAPAGSAEAFMPWAEGELARAEEGFRTRFAPALRGLAHVVRGGRFDAEGRAKGAQRFLGWTVGNHWLTG